MDWCRTSCATSKYAGDGSVLTDVKAVRRRRRREDMEGARYVTRLSRLSAFGAIVAITVAALLMGSAGHASAQSSGWMAAVPLETGVPGNATGANIAADSQGNAIAVWEIGRASCRERVVMSVGEGGG